MEGSENEKQGDMLYSSFIPPSPPYPLVLFLPFSSLLLPHSLLLLFSSSPHGALAAKLKCVLAYFRRLAEGKCNSDGTITIKRQVGERRGKEGRGGEEKRGEKRGEERRGESEKERVRGRE